MPKVKYFDKTVELNTLTFTRLQGLFLTTKKAIATIEEQLAYSPIVEVGQPLFDVSRATFALRNYKAELPLIEHALAEKRREQNIARHERENQPKAVSAKTERQLELTEHFVQVAWERMNEPLFDAFMAEAKKRRKASRE